MFSSNLGWKNASRKHFSASAFISRSRPSASTSKMALASKTSSLMLFFQPRLSWKKFSFTLVQFFLTACQNNSDNKILFLEHIIHLPINTFRSIVWFLAKIFHKSISRELLKKIYLKQFILAYNIFEAICTLFIRYLLPFFLFVDFHDVPENVNWFYGKF